MTTHPAYPVPYTLRVLRSSFPDDEVERKACRGVREFSTVIASHPPTSRHLCAGSHGPVLIAATTLPTHPHPDVQLTDSVAFFPCTSRSDITNTQT